MQSCRGSFREGKLPLGSGRLSEKVPEDVIGGAAGRPVDPAGEAGRVARYGQHDKTGNRSVVLAFRDSQPANRSE